MIQRAFFFATDLRDNPLCSANPTPFCRCFESGQSYKTTHTPQMKHCLRRIVMLAALVGLFCSAFAQAPTTTYPVGVRQYNWMRGTRAITTYVYYPAASGTVGGAPVTNAPVAAGVFPVCLAQHGYQSSPQQSLDLILPLAAAGFIVPGPHLTNINIGDISDGDHPRDLSQVLTNTLALNNSGTPFTGKINTAQVGVSGHSMGGMTIHAMLTSYPDSRIKAAIPMSCTDQGTPSSSVVAKVLFMHGDADTLTPYSSGRQAYFEMPAPKAFLTWLGGHHTSMWGDPIMGNVAVEWMRWSLYNDTAARDRLAAAAASGHTRWESVGVDGSTTYYKLQNRGTNLWVDGMGRTTNGSNCGQWASSGSYNQQWAIETTGGYVKLRNRATALYIDGMGTSASGSAAGQWSSSGSNNQQWTQEASGGYYKYRNRATGLYLDGMGRFANGSDLGQWAGGGSYNQQFSRVAP
jgi:dienelactone hydrolase